MRAAAQIQDSRLLNVCEAWYILHGERREMVLTASFDLTCVCVCVRFNNAYLNIYFKARVLRKREREIGHITKSHMYI